MRHLAVAASLAGVLMIIGLLVLLIGLLADVISANRKLLEDLLYRVRSLELPRDRPRTPTAATTRPASCRAPASTRRWER